ncbi:MAG TPA: carboxypeptidase-like regulatory domain-containing protein [Gemmatimonadaceae bacterium]|nr:carboxypeptidase-like regulatory domain-containing protein [Gemmatimonadaceae bacterium]
MRILPTFTLVGLVALPIVGQAQVIRGTIRAEASHQPLAGATVSILDVKDSTLKVGVTTDSGRFSLTMNGAGVYAIDARRLGYTEVTTTASALAPGDTVTIILELAAAPVRLDTVYTKSRPDSTLLTKVAPGHVVVAAHYKAGKGIIVSGYQLEKSGLSLSDYLAREPGVRLSGVKQPGVPLIPADNGEFLTSNQGSQCLYARVDHWPVLFLLIQDQAATLDQVLSPKNIMAVEVYRTPAEVPPEWATDVAMTEIASRSYTLTFTYTGSDRYTIGTTKPLTPLQIRQDTVYPPPPGHPGFGALPTADAPAPICGFMQIWTKASW